MIKNWFGVNWQWNTNPVRCFNIRTLIWNWTHGQDSYEDNQEYTREIECEETLETENKAIFHIGIFKDIWK